MLHIIHPTMYLWKDTALCMYEPEDYKQRNTLAAGLVKLALEQNIAVVRYAMPPKSDISKHIDYLALESSSLRCVLDERIPEYVLTKWGLPLPAVRPAEIDVSHWESLCAVFATTAVIEQIVRTADQHFLIGGMLEACVSNFAGFLTSELSVPASHVMIVEDACAFQYAERVQKIAEKTNKLGIVRSTAAAASRALDKRYATAVGSGAIQ